MRADDLSHRWQRVWLPALLLFLAPALTLPAAARTLYWPAIDVEARLDEEGRLHVAERWTMVFDGAWNGGERGFDLRVGQKVTLHGLYRIDPESGARIALEPGDLERVDEYAWHDGNTLRWRSRLPADPPFAEEELIYLLEYTMTGVLTARGDSYFLEHDFVFPSRPGVIERATVELEVDPVWQPRQFLPELFEQRDLPPGRGLIVQASFDYTGEGRPRAARTAAPLWLRVALFAAALLGLILLVAAFLRHEEERGRLDPPDVPETLDQAWLEEHVLAWRPEEVGALWDRKVGAPEVAAVIARLVAEGKLESTVRESGKGWGKKEILELELLAERDAFSSYERKLIDKLFFEKRTATDTEAIREHYKKRGFDPAGVIRPAIDRRLRRGVDGKKLPATSSRMVWILILAVPALLALEAILRGASSLVILALLLMPTLMVIIGAIVWSLIYRVATRHLVLLTILLAVPVALWLGASFMIGIADRLGGLDDVLPGVFGFAALMVFPLAVLTLVLHVARTRWSAVNVRRRHRLAEVRRRFRDELRRPEPRLDDAWLPYILAFGLGRDVDRWFESFGAAGTATRTSSLGSAISSTGGGSSPSWSGGGGAFGGAGATAAWSAAATGLAAGVSPPSSSGGGGGYSGGGGGGSSGGGSGGGW